MNTTDPTAEVSDGMRRLESLYRGHGDKLRFLFVGAFNTAFGYALFLLMLFVVTTALTELDAATTLVPAVAVNNYFIIAQWTAWVLSVPVGTATMKYLAFRSQGHLLEQILRSYFVYLPAVAISSAILWFTVRILSLHPALGQLVTIAFATAFSYLGHKYFTFRIRQAPDRDDVV